MKNVHLYKGKFVKIYKNLKNIINLKSIESQFMINKCTVIHKYRLIIKETELYS